MIADEDMLRLGMTLFAFVFLFGLGFLYQAAHLLAGVAGLFLAFEVYDLTSSFPLALILIAISVFTIVIGLVRKDT